MLDTPEMERNYAGFWPRFAAYFIDGAIVSFMLLQIYELMQFSLLTYFASHPDKLKAIEHLLNSSREYSSSYSNQYEITQYLMYYILSAYSLVVTWVYFAGFESSPLMATPGKWLLGIYVTDEENNRVSFGKATGRHWAKIISGALLGIGYIMVGFTDYAQAMHDKMAGCLVYRK